VANRFPDLRTVPLRPAITWTLSIAYAALIDTLIHHVGQSARFGGEDALAEFCGVEALEGGGAGFAVFEGGE
jgi:hypothetical protein